MTHAAERTQLKLCRAELLLLSGDIRWPQWASDLVECSVVLVPLLESDVCMPWVCVHTGNPTRCKLVALAGSVASIDVFFACAVYVRSQRLCWPCDDAAPHDRWLIRS